MTSPATIRPAVADDAETIADFIRELAAYEKLEHTVRADADSFRRHLFGPRPSAEALMADVEGVSVGLALFFPTFSTFRGAAGLYLEDVYVRPEHRGRGIGSLLFRELARIAADRGFERLEWSVLNWNAPAIAFYESLGATPLSEWTVYRLADEALARLAE